MKPRKDENQGRLDGLSACDDGARDPVQRPGSERDRESGEKERSPCRTSSSTPSSTSSCSSCTTSNRTTKATSNSTTITTSSCKTSSTSNSTTNSTSSNTENTLSCSRANTTSSSATNSTSCSATNTTSSIATNTTSSSATNTTSSIATNSTSCSATNTTSSIATNSTSCSATNTTSSIATNTTSSSATNTMSSIATNSTSCSATNTTSSIATNSTSCSATNTTASSATNTTSSSATNTTSSSATNTTSSSATNTTSSIATNTSSNTTADTTTNVAASSTLCSSSCSTPCSTPCTSSSASRTSPTNAKTNDFDNCLSNAGGADYAEFLKSFGKLNIEPRPDDPDKKAVEDAKWRQYRCARTSGAAEDGRDAAAASQLPNSDEDGEEKGRGHDKSCGVSRVENGGNDTVIKCEVSEENRSASEVEDDDDDEGDDPGVIATMAELRVICTKFTSLGVSGRARNLIARTPPTSAARRPTAYCAVDSDSGGSGGVLLIGQDTVTQVLGDGEDDPCVLDNIPVLSTVGEDHMLQQLGINIHKTEPVWSDNAEISCSLLDSIPVLSADHDMLQQLGIDTLKAESVRNGMGSCDNAEMSFGMDNEMMCGYESGFETSPARTDDLSPSRIDDPDLMSPGTPPRETESVPRNARIVEAVNRDLKDKAYGEFYPSGSPSGESGVYSPHSSTDGSSSSMVGGSPGPCSPASPYQLPSSQQLQQLQQHNKTLRLPPDQLSPALPLRPAPQPLVNAPNHKKMLDRMGREPNPCGYGLGENKEPQLINFLKEAYATRAPDFRRIYEAARCYVDGHVALVYSKDDKGYTALYYAARLNWFPEIAGFIAECLVEAQEKCRLIRGGSQYRIHEERYKDGDNVFHCLADWHDDRLANCNFIMVASTLRQIPQFVGLLNKTNDMELTPVQCCKSHAMRDILMLAPLEPPQPPHLFMTPEQQYALAAFRHHQSQYLSGASPLVGSLAGPLVGPLPGFPLGPAGAQGSHVLSDMLVALPHLGMYHQ